MGSGVGAWVVLYGFRCKESRLCFMGSGVGNWDCALWVQVKGIGVVLDGNSWDWPS